MRKGDKYRMLINSARWRSLRNAYIHAHPLCEECLKKHKLRFATEVHHVRPIETGSSYVEMESLAYDNGNLESVCSECHHRLHNEMGSHRGLVQKSKEETKREVDDYIKRYFDYGEG